MICVVGEPWMYWSWRRCSWCGHYLDVNDIVERWRDGSPRFRIHPSCADEFRFPTILLVQGRWGNRPVEELAG